jgi:hypothetical protein
VRTLAATALEFETRGTVALGAIHRRLSYRGEPWPYYVLALTDGQVFLARRQPDLYDRNAQPIASMEIPPGSTVRVRYHERDGIRWMEAVQIITMVAAHSPFDPVADGETG